MKENYKPKIKMDSSLKPREWYLKQDTHRRTKMIKFIQTYDDSDDKIEITLSPDSSLPDVIQTFERFLIAAGYVFDGHLDFVEEEEEMQYGTTL